jgi:NADH-quinone oxidoreductase subunit H
MRDPTVHKIEQMLRNPLVICGAGAVLALGLALVLWLTFPLYRGILAHPFWFPILVMALMLFLILNGTALCILAERKIASFTQDRHGPNRVGFWGLLQPIADGMKFLFKEDITPANVDKPLFFLAPAISLVIALIGFVIIPWAGDVRWPWAPDTVVRTQVASLDIGILYLLGVASLSVYGIVLAGYASNNKYSFYGGIRATAQMISYELPMGLALLCLLLTAGTLRLEDMVAQQAATGLWYVFFQPLPFLLFLISSFAETNRAPFDLAEAEQELVGGFHTEYSSMKFAMFFLAEYAHVITGSAVIVALFCGGWHFWGLPGADDLSWWAMLLRLAVYLAKVALFIGLFMFVRWTIPRFRFDQLMRLAWLSMVPVGIALVAGTAVLATFNVQRTWWAPLALNVLTLVVVLWVAARAQSPVTGRQPDLPDIEILTERAGRDARLLERPVY